MNLPCMLLLMALGAPVSLTTVPPSPVSERVPLDVRAGVWNESNARAVYAVRFYLDAQTPENLFHEEKLEVAAKSCAGVYARRPMVGLAGTHKILAVVSGTEDSRTVSRTVEVVAANAPSLGVIGGAWIEFYHWSGEEGRPWNETVKQMTAENWR